MPIETTENYKYSKTHLEQIKDLFNDANNYNELLNYFFGDKKIKQVTRKKIETLRTSIISLTETLIENHPGKNKTIQSEELTKLIADFQEFGNDTIYDKEVIKSNEKALNKKIRKMVKITDKLSNIVPFHIDGSQSSNLLKDANTPAEFKKQATMFIANNAYAKIYASKGKYEPTEFEKTHICKYQGINISAYNPVDYKQLNPQEIETDLKNSFNFLMGTDFVKNANKTNLLKKFGLRTRNWLLSGGAALTALAGANIINITNMPLDGISWQAIGTFALNNAVLFASTFSLTGGAFISGQFIRNRNFNRQTGLRHQISKIPDHTKREFFELVNKNKNYKAFVEACKSWNKENPESKIDINFEKINRRNYNFLRQTVRKASTFATKADKKYSYVMSEVIQRQTSKDKDDKKMISTALTSKFSEKNPLSKILGIEGTKPTTRAKKVSSQTIEQPVAVAEKGNDSPYIATHEETPFIDVQSKKTKVKDIITEDSKKSMDKIRTIIKGQKKRIQTFTIEFNDTIKDMAPLISGAKIEVDKTNTKKKGKIFVALMKNISHKIDSGKFIKDLEDELIDMVKTDEHEPRSFGDEDNSVTIKITPLIKDDPSKR